MEIEVKEIHKSGMYSIFGPHGKHVPAYYRTEAEAQADLDATPDNVRTAICNIGDDYARLIVIDYFHRVRGTIPHTEGSAIENREMWRKYEVQADSLPDFMKRYYKPDRYHERGKEYAATLLAGHQEDFDRDGFDVISSWDSVTGQTVAFFGATASEIKDDGEHQTALERIETLMDASPGTEEEKALDRLSAQVEAYEEKTFPIGQGVSQPMMF